jgi:hypothetical protein
VHRSDGEHVGHLVLDGAPGPVFPVTIVGAAIDPAREPAAAAALLEERGPAALERRWWCRLPAALPRGVLAAGDPPAGWGRRPVVLVEVSPDGCRVRPEMAAPEELTAQAVLPVPVGALLRAEAP